MSWTLSIVLHQWLHGSPADGGRRRGHQLERFALTPNNYEGDGHHQVSNDPFVRPALRPRAVEVRMRSLTQRGAPCARRHPSEAKEAILLCSRQEVRSRQVDVADDLTECHVTVEQQLGVTGTPTQLRAFPRRSAGYVPPPSTTPPLSRSNCPPNTSFVTPPSNEGTERM